MRKLGLFFVIILLACNDNSLTPGGFTNDLGARTNDLGARTNDLGARTNDLGAILDGALGRTASCSGLAETACATSPGCAADYCHFCGCEISAFVGCRGVNEIPSACPTPSCPAGICCASNANCVLNTGSVCVAPGQPAPHCGSECTSDADCAGRGPNPKCLAENCDNACCGNFCAPGCNADSDCADGEVCTGGLCVAPACRASSPSCPDNFACSGSSCARTSCATDTDCVAANRCVLGQCYAGLGACEAPSH